MNTSFSVAKSVTSLMVGVALEQGLITSAADPVTKYLPQLAKTDQRYTEVTVANLLDMRSGIEFADHDLPWGDKPKAYYYPRLRERILQLKVTDQPGGAFKYNSYNPIVLGMILENVALKSPARYFEEMIWNKLGMEFSGSWSTDSESSMMTKMESGINLRAIDFAKLGRLMLFRGNWNGRQIISTEWVDQCTTIDLAHQLTEFGPEIYYENFWWLFSRDQQKPVIVSGWGHLGQFLYIFPAEQVIIVRMGKRTGDVDSWSKVFTAIVAHLEP